VFDPSFGTRPAGHARGPASATGPDQQTTWSVTAEVRAASDGLPTAWYFSVRTPTTAATLADLAARWDSSPDMGATSAGGAVRIIDSTGDVHWAVQVRKAVFETTFSTPVGFGYQGVKGANEPGVVEVSCPVGA
jgi:hypothetical protein